MSVSIKKVLTILFGKTSYRENDNVVCFFAVKNDFLLPILDSELMKRVGDRNVNGKHLSYREIVDY